MMELRGIETELRNISNKLNAISSNTHQPFERMDEDKRHGEILEEQKNLTHATWVLAIATIILVVATIVFSFFK